MRDTLLVLVGVVGLGLLLGFAGVALAGVVLGLVGLWAGREALTTEAGRAVR